MLRGSGERGIAWQLFATIVFLSNGYVGANRAVYTLIILLSRQPTLISLVPH